MDSLSADCLWWTIFLFDRARTPSGEAIRPKKPVSEQPKSLQAAEGFMEFEGWSVL